MTFFDEDENGNMVIIHSWCKAETSGLFEKFDCSKCELYKKCPYTEEDNKDE
jgi:hypothetical protein